MATRIKHVAIVSGRDFALEGRFYQALFGMKAAADSRVSSAVSITDGYVGMNVNPRAPGRQAGFDHFGFEVDDVEEVRHRVSEAYPGITLLTRPTNRPFAGISMHDPAGNTFDLSHSSMANRTDVYTEVAGAGRKQPRRISHFMLRVVDPVGVARFYRDVFDFEERPKNDDDPSHYLSDGAVTLVIAPWQIEDYTGSGIERPQLDHLGFTVESLKDFQNDLEALCDRNPYLAPLPLKKGAEGQARHKLLMGCRYGSIQLSDPDGVLLDISEG
ncbi:MAG TPA: VOC family protein [Chloroflexota bacterium]|jgi:predicted enzyme related to lactoylglutathione lyase